MSVGSDRRFPLACSGLSWVEFGTDPNLGTCTLTVCAPSPGPGVASIQSKSWSHANTHCPVPAPYIDSVVCTYHRAFLQRAAFALHYGTLPRTTTLHTTATTTTTAATITATTILCHHPDYLFSVTNCPYPFCDLVLLRCNFSFPPRVWALRRFILHRDPKENRKEHTSLISLSGGLQVLTLSRRRPGQSYHSRSAPSTTKKPETRL
jgi:hypothetical protein